MKRIALMLLVCAVAFPAVVRAEHPEHPAEKKQAKKKEKKDGEWVKDSATMEAFVEAVEDYVAMQEEDEGSFDVEDEKLKKTWKLSLIRIHKDRIARLGEDKFFACADFETVGKGKRQTLDLDFFVTRGEDGEFFVDEIPVHKVDGKPRYTYNKANERVAVEEEKKAPAAKGKPKLKKHEHPTGGGSEHPEHPN